MRIAGNTLGNVGRASISNAILRNNKPNLMGTGKTEKQEHKDKAVISPMGKGVNLINDLMKKKQEIIDSKNEYIKVSTENKVGFDVMKDRIKMFDEQLKEVEKQLVEAFKQNVDLEDSLKAEKVKTGESDAEKIKQVLKEKGFQPINSGSFEGIVSTATKLELATKQRGVKQRAEVKLSNAERSEFTPPEELVKLEEAVDRSTRMLASTTIEANNSALDSAKNSDGVTSPIESIKDGTRSSADAEMPEGSFRDAPYVPLRSEPRTKASVDDGKAKTRKVPAEELEDN